LSFKRAEPEESDYVVLNAVKNPTCPYVVLRAKPEESLLKTGIRSFAIAQDDKGCRSGWHARRCKVFITLYIDLGKSRTKVIANPKGCCKKRVKL
jgi:hypothetical protein